MKYGNRSFQIQVKKGVKEFIPHLTEATYTLHIHQPHLNFSVYNSAFNFSATKEKLHVKQSPQLSKKKITITFNYQQKKHRSLKIKIIQNNTPETQDKKFTTPKKRNK
jgi:hypothetical protein